MQCNVFLDKNDKTLYAELSPGSDDSVSLLSLKLKLDEIGFGNIQIPISIVKEIVANFQAETECRIAIKTLVDAKVTISISADKLKALITLTAADAGQELSLKSIYQAIVDSGVESDLVQKNIVKQCLERKNVLNVCFANAILPLRGEDAQYISLVESESVTAPDVDDHGVADMLSTHQFRLVEAETHLMKRIPATEGKPGTDVNGEEIKAELGSDPGFLKDMTGVIFSPTDENLLISNIKGHPVVFCNGVNVDPTIHVKNVDLTTGNIIFDGSLEVNGDVVPGMSIDVTGDVFIKGSIERSTIKAGNNITVGGGVFGGVSGEEKEIHHKPSYEAEKGNEADSDAIEYELFASGNVEAKFVSLSSIYAKQSVVVKEYIGNSYVKAGKAILLGQDGGKGVIFGGFSEAAEKIVANQLGTESYVPTHVNVGELKHFLRLNIQIKKEVAKRTKEATQLDQILRKIKQAGNPDVLGKLQLDKARKISNTVTAIYETIKGLNKQLQEVDAKMEQHKDDRVIVVRAVYPNSTIEINGAIKKITSNIKGCSLMLRDDEVSECNEKE